jgi:hypothetical protein
MGYSDLDCPGFRHCHRNLGGAGRILALPSIECLARDFRLMVRLFERALTADGRKSSGSTELGGS